MPRKLKPKPATAVDLASFAAIQIRTNLHHLAEVRALREMLLQHLAQVHAIQEMEERQLTSGEDRDSLESKFRTVLEQKFESLIKRIEQRLYEQAEDESPEIAAMLDVRKPEDVEPGL